MNTSSKTFDHHIQIDWNTDQGVPWWNDTCALVLEVFGLPGNRFMYTPHEDYMIFKFTNEKDANLCKILLSDRL